MTEEVFSRRIRKALQAEGFRAIPIETGGTATGIPDLLVLGWGIVTFMEVKSHPVKKVSAVLKDEKLLGPGQREFMREFNKATIGAGTVGKFCLVAVACSDGIAVMRVSRNGELKRVSTWENHGNGSFKEKLSEAVAKGYFGEEVF